MGKMFVMTQATMIELSKIIAQLHIDEYLKQISVLETEGPPFRDPVLFRRVTTNLEAMKDLAQSFKQVQATFEKTKDIILKSAVAQFEKTNHT